MIFIVFDRFFAGIFTSNPKIVELATIRMTYILIFEVLNMTIEIMSGSLRGLGSPMISTLSVSYTHLDVYKRQG